MASCRIGRYQTLRPIAAGGMATVYLARSVGAGGFERLVALKSMHPHLAGEPEFIAMFLDEARLAAGIRHPNVVATIDVQQDDEGVFLVMELVDGPALNKVLRHVRKQRTALPLDIVLRVALDVLAGLHAAHELTGPGGVPLSLVHRDVSPPNVLVGLDGVTRLTDFGVARAESRLALTSGGQVKGKLPYMAPEQVRSDALDRRCDVYATGAVLWEMLVGSRLHQADNDAALVAKILGGVIQSPRELRPAIPKAISDVCCRALAPEPTDRYASAADFAAALEDAAAKAGVAIATTRAVGAFLREQALHTALHERVDTAPSVTTGTDASAAAAAVAPAAETPSVRSARTEGAAVLSTSRAAYRRHRMRHVALLAAGVLALPVGFIALRALRASPAPIAAAPPVAPAGPPVVVASGPVAPAIAPEAPPEPVVAPPPPGSRTAPNASAAAKRPRATVEAKAPRTATPPRGPTGFRPNEL